MNAIIESLDSEPWNGIDECPHPHYDWFDFTEEESVILGPSTNEIFASIPPNGKEPSICFTSIHCTYAPSHIYTFLFT